MPILGKINKEADMQKFLKNFLLLILSAATACILLFAVACETVDPKEKTAAEKVFAQAKELGYEGTYDEFIALVSGKDGKDGADGLSVKSAAVNEKGELIITLSDDSTVNAGVVKGADGQDGQDGQDGAPGKDGTNGQDGEDGADGADGATWLVGSGAPAAETGKDGDFYFDKDAFDVYRKSDDAWTKIGNIKGADGQDGNDGQDGAPGKDGEDGQDGAPGKDGEDGADGATWLVGSGAPAAETGKDGDLYLDEVGFVVYQKADGAWKEVGCIKGEDGADAPDVPAKQVTVTYDAQGGTLPADVSETETLEKGEYASLPVPVREGYIFGGWFSGTGVNAGQVTEVTPVMKDLTLIAKWTEAVRFEYKGETSFDAKVGDYVINNGDLRAVNVSRDATVTAFMLCGGEKAESSELSNIYYNTEHYETEIYIRFGINWIFQTAGEYELVVEVTSNGVAQNFVIEYHVADREIVTGTVANYLYGTGDIITADDQSPAVSADTNNMYFFGAVFLAAEDSQPKYLVRVNGESAENTNGWNYESQGDTRDGVAYVVPVGIWFYNEGEYTVEIVMVSDKEYSAEFTVSVAQGMPENTVKISNRNVEGDFASSATLTVVVYDEAGKFDYKQQGWRFEGNEVSDCAELFTCEMKESDITEREREYVLVVNFNQDCSGRIFEFYLDLSDGTQIAESLGEQGTEQPSEFVLFEIAYDRMSAFYGDREEYNNAREVLRQVIDGTTDPQEFYSVHTILLESILKDENYLQYAKDDFQKMISAFAEFTSVIRFYYQSSGRSVAVMFTDFTVEDVQKMMEDSGCDAFLATVYIENEMQQTDINALCDTALTGLEELDPSYSEQIAAAREALKNEKDTSLTIALFEEYYKTK